MVKKLLYLIVLLTFGCIANAQELKKGEELKNFEIRNSLLNRPATRAYAQEVFRYSDMESLSILGMGGNFTGTYNCAIYVPSDYSGKQIEAIGYLFADATVISDVKAWVASTLPTNVNTGCDFLQEITNPSSIMTDNSVQIVELTAPYTIPENGCYVGYTFNVTNATSQYGMYPVIFDTSVDTDGGLYLSIGEEDWNNYYGLGFGNLVTQVIISGYDYPDNAVIFNGSTFPTVYGQQNGNATVSLSIKNIGASDITSVAYTVKDVATNNISEEMTAQVEELYTGESYDINITIPAGETLGISTKEITLTKVNGQVNEAANNATITGDTYVLSRLISRKIVEEEFTSTSCGYCPRGIVGMEQMEELYPDNFIGIAVHGRMSYIDPMKVTDYDDVLEYIPGYPYAYLNRTGFIDPYYGTGQESLGIINDFEAISKDTYVEVEVTPMWNEDNTVINVNTDVTFLIDDDEAPYALAYVLLADGLKGTSTYWRQSNYFSNDPSYANDPYMYEWTQKPSYVPASEMVYNNVAIAAQSILNGVEGSITAPIVTDATQTHTTSFDLTNGIKGGSSEELVQDKSQLTVVAMLINTETGEIVNADKKEIAPYDATGISTITTADENATEVARYGIDGRLITTPAKGINIIKLSNGTTKKVIVK